jgi:pilus assembly protein CpaC
VVNFNNSNPFTASGRPLVGDNLGTASALNRMGLPTVSATLRRWKARAWCARWPNRI